MAHQKLTLEEQAKKHKFIRGFLKGLTGGICRIIFRIKYEGIENIPQTGSFILVSNHTSMIDIVVIHCKLKRWLHWVAKKELFQAPVMSFIMPRMGAIPVDRDKVDLTAARGIFSVLQSGEPVAMFPQGTRVKPEKINKTLPKSGIAHFAIKTDAVLIPVAIEGKFRLFNKVRCVFGKPFKLDTQARKKYTHQELLDISVDVMRHVYKLIDIDYLPESENNPTDVTE